MLKHFRSCISAGVEQLCLLAKLCVQQSTAELQRRVSELEHQLTRQKDANVGLKADNERLHTCLSEHQQQYKVNNQPVKHTHDVSKNPHPSDYRSVTNATIGGYGHRTIWIRTVLVRSP